MALKPIPETALENVRDRESLFDFLGEYLKWPVKAEDTFTYTGPQPKGEAATRVEVSQIVPFSGSDPFLIMLAEFQSKFRRSDLREILRGIRRDQRVAGKYGARTPEEIVFVCAVEDYSGIRFAHFKEQDGRQPRISVFGWDRDQVAETRTLRDINLPALTMPPLNVLDEPDWEQCLDSWYGAWDVEKVTKAFFREYREVFEQVEKMVTDVEGDKRLFTQRLFNRLLFIQFLQKKRWLRFNGSTNYLSALFQATKKDCDNFFRGRLYWVFFCGLGRAGDYRTDGSDEVHLIRRRGHLPFLNGGLFEMEDDDDTRGAVSIENEAFERIIYGLFEKYNFTVTESTPLDVEVAVDPEMLGKVFEELVTGRHETGSYYTPKPVVSFMCREALKGYLQSALRRESEEAVQRFVDEHDPEGLHDPEAALDALKRVKACDPACGSGAYLLGMLHELLDLRACLFATKNLDAVTTYQRKLEIIQNNLYGVDNDPFAVNIARLRLWLSLVVDDTRNPLDDPSINVSLPNLDFKIEIGDSLLAPDPSGGLQPDMYRQQQIADFLDLKARYMVAHGADKSSLRDQTGELNKQIAAWAHPGLEVAGFDWQVEFAEVMSDGGFDIVVANPPYVRQERIKDIKPALKRAYGDLYCGTADLYVYFYLRAIQLLRQGGMLAFISSNKWFRANYGTNLRRYIAESCTVRSITDFGELPVFNAATFPMIFVARKDRMGPRETVFTQVKSLDEPYPDVLALVKGEGCALPKDAISGANWTLADAASADRIRKMERAGVPLAEYVNGRIYYGVKTGFNTAFVIDGEKREELIAQDPKSAEIIKPLAVGDDIRRWRIVSRDRWLIVTRIGVDMKRHPAIFQHLRQWKAQLEKRWDKGNHWWELRTCDYYDAFEKPKIVYPIIGRERRFAYDTSGLFINDKAFLIPCADLYLLALLNSGAVWDYLRGICSALGDADNGGRLELRAIYMGRVPVPDASRPDRNVIASLAKKCLDAGGIGCEEWEKEIDERVAGLYGL